MFFISKGGSMAIIRVIVAACCAVGMLHGVVRAEVYSSLFTQDSRFLSIMYRAYAARPQVAFNQSVAVAVAETHHDGTAMMEMPIHAVIPSNDSTTLPMNAQVLVNGQPGIGDDMARMVDDCWPLARNVFAAVPQTPKPEFEKNLAALQQAFDRIVQSYKGNLAGSLNQFTGASQSVPTPATAMPATPVSTTMPLISLVPSSASSSSHDSTMTMPVPMPVPAVSTSAMPMPVPSAVEATVAPMPLPVATTAPENATTEQDNAQDVAEEESAEEPEDAPQPGSVSSVAVSSEEEPADEAPSMDMPVDVSN